MADRRQKPWESEQAAFSLLMRVVAYAAALVLIVLLLRAIF